MFTYFVWRPSVVLLTQCDNAVINEQIDKAATVLNSMMEEIHQDTFVSGAVAEITGARVSYCFHAALAICANSAIVDS